MPRYPTPHPITLAASPRQHRCCDYAQHDGVVIPAVTAEPKPRHSVRSRGIHASLSNATPHHPGSPHANIDAAATHSMTTGVIPAVTAEPKLRHSVRSRGIHASLSNATPHHPGPPPRQHRCCDYAQHDDRRHSSSNRRTQTSSFRAQSRNPCLAIQRHTPSPRQPPRQHRCCDYAQHDDRRHSSSNRRTQTSSFRAQSRNPCLAIQRHTPSPRQPPHANIDAATTRSMTTLSFQQ